MPRPIRPLSPVPQFAVPLALGLLVTAWGTPVGPAAAQVVVEVTDEDVTITEAAETDADGHVIGSADDPEIRKWEPDIAALVARDADGIPDDAILFVGSSSIRLWDSIDEDMAPWPVIQRGYGGAALLDVRHYAPRLVENHNPRAIVLFAGNDIKGSPRDRTPDQVANLFVEVCERLRNGDADRPIFYVGVTPTPQRFRLWPQIDAANDQVEAICEATPHTYFIPTDDIYIVDGQPNLALFGDDNLHQNADGYARWSDRIKTRLHATLNATGQSPAAGEAAATKKPAGE